MRDVIRNSDYVFEFVYDDKYKVVKDKFGDFKNKDFVDYETVEDYFNSGYNVTILDYKGGIDKFNFL